MKLPPMSEPSPAPPSASWTQPTSHRCWRNGPGHPSSEDAQSEDVEEVAQGKGGWSGGWSIPREAEVHTWLETQVKKHLLLKAPGDTLQGDLGLPGGAERTLWELGNANLWLSAKSKLRERKQTPGPRTALHPSRRIVHRTHCTLRPHPASRALRSPRPPSGSGSGSSTLAAVQAPGTEMFFQTLGGG